MRRATIASVLSAQRRTSKAQQRHFTNYATAAAAAATTGATSSLVMAATALGATGTDPGLVCGVPVLFAATVTVGFVARCCTVPLSCYGDRAVARCAQAGPALHRAFLKYAEVVWHPKALRGEIEMSKEKLQGRRKRIFKEHSTSNAQMLLPLVGSAAVLTGGLAVLAGHTAALQALAAAPAAVPLSLLWFDDPRALCPLAAWCAAVPLSLLQCDLAIRRRLGFGDHKDKAYGRLRVALASTAAGAVVVPVLDATVVPGLLAATPLGPLLATTAVTVGGNTVAVSSFAVAAGYWLGVAVASLLQVAVNRAAPLKRAVGWPLSYPAQHGQYDEYTYQPGAHMTRVKDAVDDSETEQMQTQYADMKRVLEHDCDLRLSKSKLFQGLFRDTRYDTPPERAQRPDDELLGQGTKVLSKERMEEIKKQF